jgi:hypothetical protein
MKAHAHAVGDAPERNRIGLNSNKHKIYFVPKGHSIAHQPYFAIAAERGLDRKGTTFSEQSKPPLHRDLARFNDRRAVRMFPAYLHRDHVRIHNREAVAKPARDKSRFPRSVRTREDPKLRTVDCHQRRLRNTSEPLTNVTSSRRPSEYSFITARSGVSSSA